MYYSKNIYPKTKAGETNFAFTFPYLNKTDVHAKIVRSGAVSEATFTFLTDNQIQLNTPTQLNDIVTVYRKTALDKRAVDFQNGAVLTEKDLDDANIQLFYAMQEAEDNANSGMVELADGVIDARQAEIINVVDPTSPKSAANKDYVDNKNKVLSDSVDQRIEAIHQTVDKELADTEQHIYSDNDETEANIKADNAATAAKIKADNDETEANIKADNATTRDHTTADVKTVTDAKTVVLQSEQHVVSLDKETTTNTQTALDAAKRAKDEADRAASNATLAGLPLGSYVWYPADDPKNVKDKNGLFLPDGRELQRSAYPDLWNAVKSGDLPSVSEAEWQAGQKGVYSTGDGVTTFRLPSIGGYFVRIAGGADPDASTRKVGAFQADQNKAHSHKLTLVADAVKTATTSSFDYGTKTASGVGLNKRFWTNTTGNHAHSGSTSAAGNHAHSVGFTRNDQGYGVARYGGSWDGGKGGHLNTNTTGNHSHSFSTNTTGNHSHYLDANFGTHSHTVAIGSHTHTVSIPAHTHEATAASDGGSEARPKNTWMQPYIVWYQANNAKIGGFQLHGSWDVERNIVIGDPLNSKLTKGVAPSLPVGMTADGIGYLCVTSGYSDIIGEKTYMVRGDRVVWYGSTWVHIQHSQVTSVNGETGDVDVTADSLDVYTKEQVDEITNGIANSAVKKSGDTITGSLTVEVQLNANRLTEKGYHVYSENNLPQRCGLNNQYDGAGNGHNWNPSVTRAGLSAALFNQSDFSDFVTGTYGIGHVGSWTDVSVPYATYSGVNTDGGHNKPICQVIATGSFGSTNYQNVATTVAVQNRHGNAGAIEIVDFNSFVQTGIFLQDSNVNQYKCTNRPCTNAGMLEVFRFSKCWIFQRYTDYTLNTMYTRCKYNGNWNAWHSAG
ncbi:TPA: phage tail fiber protein [Photobacterium damselae]